MEEIGSASASAGGLDSPLGIYVSQKQLELGQKPAKSEAPSKSRYHFLPRSKVHHISKYDHTIFQTIRIQFAKKKVFTGAGIGYNHTLNTLNTKTHGPPNRMSQWKNSTRRPEMLSKCSPASPHAESRRAAELPEFLQMPNGTNDQIK